MLATLRQLGCAPTGVITLMLALGSSCATLPHFFFQPHGDGKVVQTATSRCVLLAPEVASTPLKFCETAATYQLITAAGQRFWTKKALEQQIRAVARRVLVQADDAESLLKNGRLELWLTAGVMTPEDPDFVFVLKSRRGNVSFHLPIWPEQWPVAEPRNFRWLAKADYPGLKSWRADELILDSYATSDPKALRLALSEAGILALSTTDGRTLITSVEEQGGRLKLQTLPLATGQVMQALANKTLKSLALLHVAEVPAGEAEGYKTRLFELNTN